MASLTERDYSDLSESIHIIRHVTEDGTKRPLIEWLKIIEFVAVETATLFFKNGKPKTTLQLILMLPAIIGFVRRLIAMIKGEATKKGKTTLEQKTIDAIEAGRQNAKAKRVDDR